TMGMEGVDDPVKDREALRWCQNVERLTGKSWAYLKVKPQDLETYRAQEFKTLVRATTLKPES
ncbi:MAG: hypothetical protein ACP5Q4_09730, partial [Candidatus Caldatribacteriaceae bacterium]